MTFLDSHGGLSKLWSMRLSIADQNSPLSFDSNIVIAFLHGAENPISDLRYHAGAGAALGAATVEDRVERNARGVRQICARYARSIV
jgi:hypothetical protein